MELVGPMQTIYCTDTLRKHEAQFQVAKSDKVAVKISQIKTRRVVRLQIFLTIGEQQTRGVRRRARSCETSGET